MQDVLSPENAESPAQAAVDTQEPKPGRRKTSMVLINFWLDAGLLISIAFLGWVSAMMQVVFPAPTAADGWELWGLTFDQWRDLQFGSLCVCGLLALEHLALHWNWVCGVITTKVLRVKSRPDEGVNAVYGVGTFIGIMTVMLAGIIVAIVTVKRPPA